MKFILSLLFGVATTVGFSQSLYKASNIPDHLKENANSVIRLESVSIEIPNPKKIVVNSKEVITILNKNGNRHFSPVVHYNNASKIKSVEARIFDADGEEIEKFKKKDFYDVSAVSGVTLYSDDRMLVFDYTPTEYPYTIQFEYETESSNTAFVNRFIPLNDYHSSVAKSNFSLTYGPNVSIKFKKVDREDVIAMSEQPGNISLSVENLKAIEPERHSHGLKRRIPGVTFAVENFYLQGVPGNGKDWVEFGKWMNAKLLQDVQELPAATKSKIKDMVAGATSLEEKARIVYEYVQKNTRYISVQVGIGGWKPMPASEVDKLGYGDCKALTNYTKSLLDAADVPSYYTVVYGDRDKRSISTDFTSMQGNHIILAVPNEDETIWLECTSQTSPFGFIANFTDDRDVLMVTPEGGKIAHTKSYPYEGNSLKTTGTCVLDEEGDILVNVAMESKGTQYSHRYDLESKTKDEKDEYYKEYWDYIDNITLKSVDFNNDKKAVELKETLQFQARSYTSSAGENLIFPVNVLNRSTYIPKRYKERKSPLYIPRGFVDEDEVLIDIPPGFGVTSLPEPIYVETKFGVYASELQEKSEGKYLYKRKFEIYEGEFPKEEYENYRKFRKKVARHDNQKIILTKL